MENDLMLRKLVTELEFVDNLYDYIRLVDPLKKKVLSYSKDGTEKSLDIDQKCYEYFGRTIACENCISIRAINNKKAIFKIEYANPNIYLITAVPVKLEEIWYAVELFKDITNDGIIDVEGKEVWDTKQLIDSKNSMLVRDSFTRIFNENFINSRLPHDIFKAQDENRKLAMFLISIKNLKIINSVLGFQVGDHIIKEFSTVIKKYVRKPEDWAARYGGAEFIIVMYDVDAKQAYRICKRIYDKLSKIELSNKHKMLKTEFDIGFHILDNVPMTAEELILYAGKNMYKGIDEPINKSVVIASEEIFHKYLFTGREKDVALLLLEGKSNTEIAQSLYIGLSTVKKHIANIFEKTHVKSRSEFIAKVKKQI